MWLPWACGLCAVRHANREFMHQHLRDAHGQVLGLEGDLRIQLLAAKGYPDHSENTLGYYDGERLLAIHVRRAERAPDDPMRFA